MRSCVVSPLRLFVRVPVCMLKQVERGSAVLLLLEMGWSSAGGHPSAGGPAAGGPSTSGPSAGGPSAGGPAHTIFQGPPGCIPAVPTLLRRHSTRFPRLVRCGARARLPIKVLVRTRLRPRCYLTGDN